MTFDTVTWDRLDDCNLWDHCTTSIANMYGSVDLRNGLGAQTHWSGHLGTYGLTEKTINGGYAYKIAYVHTGTTDLLGGPRIPLCAGNGVSNLARPRNPWYSEFDQGCAAGTHTNTAHTEFVQPKNTTVPLEDRTFTIAFSFKDFDGTSPDDVLCEAKFPVHVAAGEGRGSGFWRKNFNGDGACTVKFHWKITRTG